MSSVLQPWVETMSWKCQSILFSGLRGPDHALCPNIKKWSRWMRAVSLRNADPSKSYMTVEKLPTYEEVAKELEHSPVHYVHHFMDALQVVAVGHYSQEVCVKASGLYYVMADELFHWVPETDSQFLERHKDKVEHR